MEWWYKCEKYPVDAGNKSILQDSLKNTLRQANNLAVVHLYNDEQAYYIRTSNRISLNHYLNQNGFEELEEGKPETELQLLYGMV